MNKKKQINEQCQQVYVYLYPVFYKTFSFIHVYYIRAEVYRYTRMMWMNM